MLARLIKTNSKIILLYPDGTSAPADSTSLWRLFTGFQKIDQFKGNDVRWDTAYLDIDKVPGHTLAFVDEGRRLVVLDPSAFNDILAGSSVEEYLTATEYANAVGKTVGRIKQMCQAGRIAGVVQKGGQWLIPKYAEYPVDARTYAKKKSV